MDFSTPQGEAVARRLREEEVIWLTTVRSDGQPQSVPVWAIWDGESFLIYSRPDQQKLRNIRSNPRVSLHLDSDGQGGGIVRIEGTAELVEDAPPCDQVPAYVEKYAGPIERIGFDAASFAAAYPVPIRVTPTRWVAF